MSGRKIILGINDDTTLHGGDGDDQMIILLLGEILTKQNKLS
jgi:hypothetical protein